MKILEAKPFVKWAGGKQALASQIVDSFPSEFSKYYEPFVGGGSVFLTCLPNVAILGDANEWLVSTYEAIRDDFARVAKLLDKLPNTKEDFLRIRELSRTERNRWKLAAYFIYLNKTCFRGLYRVNQKNQFNVPYGAYDRRYYDLANLESVSTALANATFCVSDFEVSVANAESEDFIYFDPPYYKQGGYSDFNRYTPNQFKEGDHLRLASLCQELEKRGVRWLVSNSDTPFVRQLYKGFQFKQISSRRDINLKSNRRSINELLISNY